jgi:hypothetical protein
MLLHIKNMYSNIFIVLQDQLLMIFASENNYSLKNLKILRSKVTKILQIRLIFL